MASLAFARALASVWRFRTLAFSERAFGDVDVPRVLVRKFMGYRLHVDVSRSNAQRLLYLEGERFIAELPLLRALVKPSGTVVDVGANIGYYLLLFARLAGPRARIVAFEPEPDNLAELRLNREDNGLGRVEIRAQAVGAGPGVVRFARGINGGVVSGEGAEATVEVPQVALDDALEGPVDMIKIDVEGYEGEVLEGARRCIERWRPALFVEIHPTLMHPRHSVRGILEFLSAYYDSVELFEPARTQSFGRKVLSRYLGIGAVAPIPREEALRRVSIGKQDTFWAVCRAGRT